MNVYIYVYVANYQRCTVSVLYTQKCDYCSHTDLINTLAVLNSSIEIITPELTLHVADDRAEGVHKKTCSVCLFYMYMFVEQSQAAAPVIILTVAVFPLSIIVICIAVALYKMK